MTGSTWRDRRGPARTGAAGRCPVG
jgi:hypothetical protein